MSNKTSIIRDVILSIFDIVVTLISVFKKNPQDKPSDNIDNDIDSSDDGHRITRN